MRLFDIGCKGAWLLYFACLGPPLLCVEVLGCTAFCLEALGCETLKKSCTLGGGHNPGGPCRVALGPKGRGLFTLGPEGTRET